jgi:hypothetical protein
MSKNNNSDKINSLQKHVEKLKTQQTTRIGGELETYKNWVKLEISRTEKKIASLK